MTLALLCSMVSVAGVSAHFVDIESKNGRVASRGEWFGPQGEGTGSIVTQRNSAQQGEVIFNDDTKDQRLITLLPTETDPITRAADLDWFGVTADADNIYFVAKVERYGGITQDYPIELMISIDTNHQAGQGTLELPNTAGISVTADAAWEYVVNTRFSKGSAGVASGATTIYTTGGSASGSNCGSSCQAQLASAAVSQGSFAEIAVPWSRIGGKPTGANYLRFTVSSYHLAENGGYPRQVPPLGNQNTAVIDILDRSNSVDETITAIADGQMDEGSAFDVHFNTNGGAAATYEPYAPLLITEFQPNPVGDDSNVGPQNPIQTESEYIEIYNPNGFQINLTDYKVGNAARRGSSKGMFRFKSGTIAPNEVIIVAKYKNLFLAGWRERHPGQPDPRVLDLTADLQQYTAYATGASITLDNGPSATQTEFNDQVVLLDAKDGIVDMVQYGSTTDPYPGQVIINVATVDEGVSFERCPAGIDSNGGFDPFSPAPSNVDFVVHSSTVDQTPGFACVGRPGVNMALEKIGPTTAQAGQPVRFEVLFSNIGEDAELPGAQVTISDTLPAGLSFQSADAPAPQVNGKQLTWTLPAPAPGGIQTSLVYTATVDAGLGENIPLVNVVTISSPNELTDADTQLNNRSEVTVLTVGPAELDLQLSGLGKTPVGKQFTLVLDYSNLGASDALDGKVTLNLPNGVTLVSATAPGATPDFSGPQVGPKAVSWTLNSELAGQTGGKITVVGQVANSPALSGQTLQFTAQFSASNTPPVDPATASGSLLVDVNYVFGPSLRK
jgi:uncharacterized repeat protein (TIGR01451 family)